MNLAENARATKSWTRFWPVLVPVIIAFAVYSWSVTFDFVSWDDDQNITQNPWFIKGEWWRFWYEHFVGMFVPVVYTVWYALFSQIKPPDPRLFHGLNVVIHAVNTGMVCYFAYNFVPRDARKDPKIKLAIVLAGVLFGLHPLQVEAVGWVTGLRDLLCCFLVLVAAQYSLSQRWVLWREIIASLAYILALLCKPSAAVVPVALGLLALAEDHRRWRLILVRYVPWLVLGLVAVIATKDIQTEVISFAVPDLPWPTRVLVAMDSYGFYLGKLFWPLNLAVDYGRTPEKMVNETLYVWPVIILITSTSIFAAALRKLTKKEIAALAFAVIALAPTSGIVRFAYQHVSTVADHYMYLPLVGIAVFVMSLASRMPQSWLLCLVISLGSIGGILTLRRLPVWRNDKTLFSSMLSSNPESYGANIGMLAIAMREERFQDGIPYLREAERLEPTNVVTLLDKWLLYVKLGRFQEVASDMPGHMLTKEQILANPNSRSTIGGQYVVLSFALMQLGDYKKSFEIACLARFAYPEHQDLPSFFPYLGGKLGLELPAEQWCR